MHRLVTFVCLLLALPVLSVIGSWIALDTGSLATLRHISATVLPSYVGNSLLLSVFVGVGVAVVGGATAATVSLFEFAGRRFFEWALLLPLAMPAYVLAYAYTDFLQFSGPLQTALRALTGAQGVLWPDVRSLPAAALLMVFCFFPYVYLLTRAALDERAVSLMEAARLLGAGTTRRVRTVALPLARPAVAAGVALALMETLADYGVGSYFGLSTLTTGIYKAWLVMNDRAAAAQLASLLLASVTLLLWLEHRAQQRLRFTSARAETAHGAQARPLKLSGAAAWAAIAVCATPVLLGFVVPVAVLLRLLAQETQAVGAIMALPWERFAQWAWTSLELAMAAALLTLVLALALSLAKRVHARGLLPWAVRALSLGYAVPGAVIAVGILLPVGWLQEVAPNTGVTALVTGTMFGLIFAYLVRFSAVALHTVEAGYSRLPRSIDETARTLGASQRRMFFELHAPLLRRSALAAALLVFVEVMKELPATLLLRPFNSDTLAVVAYQLARDERLGEAALPSLVIVLVGLIPVLLLSRAMRNV
ncbi:MAG: iron ABC transporter permease [Burkholderiaceae bacterium]|nr:iron ABC transporter permease [Burkholderiaceae bacterium]